MVAIPLIVGLLALIGLGLTLRLGQPPLPPEQRGRQRRKRQALAIIAVLGIAGFAGAIAAGGGSDSGPDCVGVAVKGPNCPR
jgi:hypothetical protein